MVVTQKRTAIVVYNLGGPDRPEAVQPFLFNLFNDSAILQLPNPFRWLLAKLISKRRTPEAQEIYHHIGGRSPILPNTEAQATALRKALEGQGNYKVFVAMRYWHPMIPEVIRSVQSYKPERVVLLPLYPQFSMTTTGSFQRLWHQEAAKAGLDVPTKEICCYPTQPDFISAHTNLIKSITDTLKAGSYRILFSAHGLPERVIKKGDPYQWQVEQAVAAVVQALNIPKLDWAICYQSRVGPLKWIGPATDVEIKRAINDQKNVVLVPIAFVSDHSETLVELDLQYRALAESGGINFYRVPTLGTHQSYIQGLKTLILQAQEKLPPSSFTCPQQFGQCPCKIS